MIFEDNDIFQMGGGIVVTEKGHVVGRNNRIHDCALVGIVVTTGGGGTFEGNDLFQQENPWNITRDCEPNVTRKNNTPP